MEYIPEVVQAIAGDDCTVYAYFSDGSVRLYDAKPLARKGGLFAKLADESFFSDRLTVMNGSVAWDVTGDHDETACIDIDPFTVYERATVTSDPLEELA